MTDILLPQNALTVYRGASVSFKVTIRDADLKPLDIRTGRVVFSVKVRAEDRDVVIQKSSSDASQISIPKGTDGVAVINLVPADTKNLTVRSYVFDIWLILAGNQYPVVTPSTFDLKAGVTVL